MDAMESNSEPSSSKSPSSAILHHHAHHSEATEKSRLLQCDTSSSSSSNHEIDDLEYNEESIKMNKKPSGIHRGQNLSSYNHKSTSVNSYDSKQLEEEDDILYDIGNGDDFDDDNDDDESLDITVMDYASTLQDFVQPAINQSSRFYDSFEKQTHHYLNHNQFKEQQELLLLHQRRTITTASQASTTSQASTPKRQNYTPLGKPILRSSKRKQSYHYHHNSVTIVTMRYFLVGLLVIVFASSSWWQIHVKHNQSISQSKTTTTPEGNTTPNPYYFWSLMYNNNKTVISGNNDYDSNDSSHLEQLLPEATSFFPFYNGPNGGSKQFWSTSVKTPSSATTTTSTGNTYTPPTITSMRSSSKRQPSSKLVIAGKMTVLDGFCNVAELSLNSGEWSLKERIQLSLYNSYSGGEVYSLLVNHTFNRNSFPFLDDSGDFVLSNGGSGGSGGGLVIEDKSKSQYQSGATREVHGGELIVVGAFDTTDRNSQTTYCSVGAWDGTELSKVGEGLCNSALSKGMKITSAAMAGPDDVYVAGSFSTQVWNGIRHEFVHIYNIAHYNALDKVWLPLPVGQISCSWCQVTVLALAYDSKRRQLHVAGKFNAIDGHNIPSGLAIYDLDSGHLVAHPGGGLTMFNETQDGVGTALQLDEEAGVLYVMGSFERMGRGQLCLGLAAYEIITSRWTCLADAAHTVLPSGGGNMLLTPYGLMVAGRTTSSTTWPDSSRPYTIALLNTTRVVNNDDIKSGTKATRRPSSPTPPGHVYTWSWLPGFDGHNEPLHSLANGFGEYEGTVFISGDNFVSAWYYEEKTEVRKSSSGVTESFTTLVPVTANLSNNNVQGAVMAIAQLKPEDPLSGNDRKVVGNTIAVYLIALGALLGMMLALLCNRSINQTMMALLFSKETQQMNGISLDTLTYSAIKNTNMNEVYQRAMKVRCVPNPHFLQLIDPQDIILHRIIGEGTFGRVWSARLNSSSVAVKEFVFAQAAVAGKSAHQNEIIEEIIGEAGMMAILRHPNVLQLFGCSLTAQAIWIVSELCSLGSLRQLLDDDERELPMQFRLKIALQVAEGMMYLHNQDPPIIHRDLKSHNILVHETFTETTNKSEEDMSENAKNAILSYRIDHSGRTKKMNSEATVVAKIGDWGSARATLSGSRSMTHGVGTACWLAPEVILHARSSKFSDVYSYGIILWELATREEVYAGLESTQIIAGVANDNLRPKVPENNPLAPLMVKCWCENPEERLTFKDIVRELNQLIDEDEIEPAPQL